MDLNFPLWLYPLLPVWVQSRRSIFLLLLASPSPSSTTTLQSGEMLQVRMLLLADDNIYAANSIFADAAELRTRILLGPDAKASVDLKVNGTHGDLLKLIETELCGLGAICPSLGIAKCTFSAMEVDPEYDSASGKQLQGLNVTIDLGKKGVMDVELAVGKIIGDADDFITAACKAVTNTKEAPFLLCFRLRLLFSLDVI
ncbi:hypothetical protein BT96DRAFT_934748 [Gymnopus androsaceus JB14]|uniref:Uncharacterized protein n=1 Tax=Gymnopus androsaceus JB14 TaxID=1447944 RepID=A0A6A4I6D8_9AGAR|nr:hypothetical protein BT96DRAFT_934748 [Gymnopus androsaceus JB14]